MAARTGAARTGADRVCIGAVAGAHGVRGLVRIRSFTEDPAAVASYGPVEDEAGERRFAISLAGSARGLPLARLDGVADRNAAEALRGMRLYVARSALPPVAEGEYYHTDLIGLTVIRRDGSVLGEVMALHNFGAGDLIEVRTGPARGASLLLPFDRDSAPEIDLARRRVIVDPPPGLLAPPDADGSGDTPGRPAAEPAP